MLNLLLQTCHNKSSEIKINALNCSYKCVAYHFGGLHNEYFELCRYLQQRKIEVNFTY